MEQLSGPWNLPWASAGRELVDEISLFFSLFFFQSNVAASNAKLALFYDWLFFSPDKDSIMNIGM